MKKYIALFTGIAAAAALVTSCKKDPPIDAGYNGTGGSAYLKIVHLAPSFRSLFNKPDSFNVYVGDTKLNGPALTYAALFPTNANTYATVPAGAQTIRFTVNGVNTPDSVTLFSLQRNFTAGASYTLALTDSINSTRDSSKIFVQDSLPATLSGPGFMYLRLMHAVLNDTAGTMVDIFSYKYNQVIISKAGIGKTTGFVAIPSLAGGAVDTLYVRRANTTRVIAKMPATFIDQHAYTLVFYGSDTAKAKPKTLNYYRNL